MQYSRKVFFLKFTLRCKQSDIFFPLFATGDPGSKFTTSIVGTSGKFGTGIKDNSGTGGKFTTRVFDTGGEFVNISANFRKNSK
jgi:hypothetical protein